MFVLGQPHPSLCLLLIYKLKNDNTIFLKKLW